MSKNSSLLTHIKENGEITMVNTSMKLPTRRAATATSFLQMAPATLAALREKALPKGDALALARVAGIQGAKWTSHLIPLCHSIELRQVEVELTLEEQGVRIRTHVETIAPTGPEMEALTGATIAGLALYDMCKAIDKSMVLIDTRLEEKSGGKSGFVLGSLAGHSAVILTLSDRASRNARLANGEMYVDKSGPLAAQLLREAGILIVHQEILPDDEEPLRQRMVELIESQHPDLLFTLGSTGLSPRDIAPEATQKIIERTLPGFPEAFRVHYFAQHPTASFLSRGVAGLRGNTLIVNLPGRPSAVQEGLTLLIPSLVHVFQMLEGEGHEK